MAGGTGYIGTHTVLSLIEEGYDVTVVDNLANSSNEGLRRVRDLTNCEESRINFFQVDLCDKEKLREVFQNSSQFSACIHFAGLKAVGESVQKPLQYYENNLLGTLNLLNLMDEYGCHAIVFSSSATVRSHPGKTFGTNVSIVTRSPRAAKGVWRCSGPYHGGHSHRYVTCTHQ